MLNGSVKLPASTNQARNAAGHSTDWPSMTWKRLFTSSTTGTAGKTGQMSQLRFQVSHDFSDAKSQ